MSARDIYKKNVEHYEKFRNKYNHDLERDSTSQGINEIDLLNNSGTIKFEDMKLHFNNNSNTNTNKLSKFDV